MMVVSENGEAVTTFRQKAGTDRIRGEWAYLKPGTKVAVEADPDDPKDAESEFAMDFKDRNVRVVVSDGDSIGQIVKIARGNLRAMTSK